MAPRSALLAALLSAGASAQPLQALGAASPSQDAVARVRARVVGPGGRPVEGLRMWLASPGPIADEAVCGLLRRSCVATDAEGWIERAVSRPGTYVLLADPHIGTWPPWILPRADVVTGAEPRLEARYARLRIRAVDRLGDPVEDGDSFCVRTVGEVWNWEQQDIGESGTATLEPDAVLIHSATRPWREDEPHTWIARPGQTYVCGWFSPSRGLVERRIELGYDVMERDMTFVLGDPTPPSSLVVEVAPGTGGRPDLPLEAHVQSPTCGAVLAGVRVPPPGSGGSAARVLLPAGRYVVAVVPSPEPLPHWGALPPESAVHRVVVDVGLGEEVRLDAPLVRGSRLTLELRAPPGSVDPRAAELVSLENGFTYLAAVSGWLPSELWGRVWIGAVGGIPPRRLRFAHEGIVVPIAGVLPGGSAKSFERLAPGRHVLRVECAGFEPAEVEVDAVDGEDLAVTVDLVPSRR